MSTESEQRISELETQIAFLEDTVAQLDKALADQHLRVDTLAVQLKELHRQMRTQAERMDALDSPESEPPPPHY